MATFTQMASGNWRVQVRRKTRYVAETFRRRKDGDEWALEMERNIDRYLEVYDRVLSPARTQRWGAAGLASIGERSRQTLELSEK